ncbi:50S ribosomal protein L22 [bacterium (Candidatus Gribaldobacteria) CG08_land_8_20_14_0_20_39_15]|uniref:Large ribosomal subunit protein uL22 n=1 Tax=bacterium (Candidatus Gribaldobacteria) CG08_land_8_20_14_0_20_39_15 TaxID=2014273 RepID=A0A2M6XV40_9BACT|nr:MAG: 50S ribosomal protein L22 [bacterium (Candidatus Gribaldobacteria) CG08_land_8_20_14_0_20_39_15]
MSVVKAQLNHLHISPRKVRLLADLIRNQQVTQAKTFLNFCVKKGSLPVKKLLDSAIANAKNNFELKEEDLFIKEIKVNEGPKMKRWRARSKGRAMPIQKKTSHIAITLDVITNNQ